MLMSVAYPNKKGATQINYQVCLIEWRANYLMRNYHTSLDYLRYFK